ncbi:MAG: hypothetical protein HOY75_08200 [Streptomyces sp.]|nr:hypothetical protein [Streptomyces sp.]
MTTGSLDCVTTLEQAATEHAWQFFLKALTLAADLGPWQTSTTSVGELLSSRVAGPDAHQAVLKFAACGDVSGVAGAFQRAQLDYGQPGRIAAVWQSNGLWVELWCPDTPNMRPEPAQAASARSFLGGRLPFTRRRKENSTA